MITEVSPSSECISPCEIFEEQTPLQSIANRIKSLVSDLFFVLKRRANHLRSFQYEKCAECYLDPAKETHTWKEKSDGLYVLIHGVNSYPEIWNDYLLELKEQHKEADFCAPYIPKAGNCSLQEAVQPLYSLLLSYIHKHPGKPICFIATSNGGRIAAELEILLRAELTKAKVFAMATPFFGSQRMDFFDSLRLASWRYDSNFIQELKYGSGKAQTQIQEMRKAPLQTYVFYGNQNDLLVSPSTSAFPKLDADEEHISYFDSEHNCIVSKAKDSVISSAVQWMKEQKI